MAHDCRTGYRRRRALASDDEGDHWLKAQQQGWADGEWLAFAALDAERNKTVGHVGLMNREGGRVGTGEQVEISYWTAPDARGQGIAPRGVRAVTDWAFGNFGAMLLPDIMLIHNVDNAASCRVAIKSGYPFQEISPANPPYWFADGHIHVARSPG